MNSDDLKGALAPVVKQHYPAIVEPPHIVPLSSQAVAILRNVQLLGVNSRYVFPSLLSRDRPMSENTVNNALRRLGYSN